MCLLQCAAFCCGVWPSVWCAVCIAVFVAMRVAVCCSHVIKLLHQGLEKGWFTERYHCKHPKHCNTLQHAATRCNTPKDKTDDKILSAKHCKASLYRTTAACHCSMSLQHAPATRTPLLQHAHFYSNVSLQHTYHHCNTHSITAACAPTCHCNIAIQRAKMVYPCVATGGYISYCNTLQYDSIYYVAMQRAHR